MDRGAFIQVIEQINRQRRISLDHEARVQEGVPRLLGSIHKQLGWLSRDEFRRRTLSSELEGSERGRRQETEESGTSWHSQWRAVLSPQRIMQCSRIVHAHTLFLSVC